MKHTLNSESISESIKTEIY
uniref:Uncharacterized protein n=1 Tax=Arundo donax TaxID=35708 RepID=A0A0A9HD41_ARUDO